MRNGRGAGALGPGLRLALTTLTVLPLRSGRVDRPTAAVAMTLAPAVGAGLGAALGVLLVALTAVRLPAPVAAVLTVAAATLLTRGLHLDGLADTADALGSYRPGADALQVMKKPDIGPFGVAAITLVLLTQAAAVASLAEPGWLAVGTLAAAFGAGRCAVPLACRRAVPPARPEGLGALVAGTVPGSLAVAAATIVAVAAVWAVPERPWQGPLAVAVAVAVTLSLVRHAVRRFGGITGDVLGAGVELATTAALVVSTLR